MGDWTLVSLGRWWKEGRRACQSPEKSKLGQVGLHWGSFDFPGAGTRHLEWEGWLVKATLDWLPQPYLHLILLIPSEEIQRGHPWPYPVFPHSKREMRWMMSPRRHWSPDALSKQVLLRLGKSEQPQLG